MSEDTPFVETLGPAFLAHVMRRVADDLVRAAERWYAEEGVTAPPRTVSTLLLLREAGPLAVTEIAGRLEQSHPLVIRWIGELERAVFVARERDERDGRRTLVALTREGQAEVERLGPVLEAMAEVSRDLAAESDLDDLVAGLWRMAGASQPSALVERLREAKAR